MKGWLFLLLATLISISSFAQTKVTGKVLSAANNQGVPGATVQVVGAKTAAITANDGTFSIVLPAGRTRLEISSVGYDNQEVTVSGPTVTVTLTEKSNTLNEVVVTGYATQKKKDLTGAVAVVDLGDAKKQPVPDVNDMLQGQASGVSVVGSGQPGASPVIHIRGFNSFGNNVPLYVVDGVPTQNVADLNTNDIATMQVLKDAGAASIYGSRASNGVIIITTKRGNGRPKVSYDGYYGTQVPKGGNVWHVLNPTEEGTLLYQAEANYNTLNPSSPTPLGNTIYGTGATPVVPDYLVSGTVGGVTYSGGFAAGSTAADPANYNADPTGTNYYQIAKANKSGTDWYHAIFKNAPIQSHNLSVAGGGDQGNYLFSVNLFDQQGTLIETHLKRYTIRANTNFKVGNRIRIGENIAYSSIDNPQANGGILVEGSAVGFSMRENPIIPVYDIGGNFAGSAPKGLNNPRNPVSIQATTSNNRGLAQRIFGNVYGEADVLKNLTYRTSFGGEYYAGWAHTFTIPDYYDAEPQYTTSTYNESSYNGGDWTWTNTLAYNLTKGDHNLKVVGGMESYEFVNHNIGGSTQNYFSYDPLFVNLTTGAGTQTNYSNSNGTVNSTTVIGAGETLVSYFARADYSYKEKYLIGGTFRRDGSSKFIENRWGNFYAVSAGWRISQEDFMKRATWITDLKIRGSYGLMGNQFNALSTNSYTLYSLDKQKTYYPTVGGTGSILTSGLALTQIGNPAAKWEQDGNLNLGFDLTVLKGQLTVSADYYQKNIKDLLYQLTLAGTNGSATVPAYNVGKMTNNGLDLMITGQTNITHDLMFNGSLSFTTFHNVIKQIDANGTPYFDVDGRRFNGSYIVRNAVGHPVSAFYGYKIAGFWQNQAEITAADQAAQKASNGAVTTYQADEGVGRFRYADGNHQGWIDASSKEFLGNPNPKFTYGANLGLTYKGFDFSVFLYGVYGNDIWNNVKWWTDFYASFPGAASSKTALYNSWTPTHTNAAAPIQDAVNGSNASTNTVPNSYFVEKGSYLRAKNTTLGYSFTSAKLTRIGITHLRAYVQAINLFTITKYSGIDPEISVNQMGNPPQNATTDFGIDEGGYANPRQYLVGLQVTF
ncbi:MAG TPA: TonB-dependent receptor [Dinghuibacter sp.]|uniref:SusC/RagA family TonB-linked outer membrane protein n=1 Tax=Dinghuibacter sp. TaxID=2024697 RepID=UPI002B6978B3|nr:TonB-dependent receptor [Dinghuibacter sp.]HTJ11665.1 TonB-dependent receptor [Dinghuibacter sp.]